MTRNEQFAFLETARASVLASTPGKGIPVHCVEFVFDFVDFSLSVWFFYETDAQLKKSETNKWKIKLANHFSRELKSAGYADEWLGKISYYYDSHENVIKNYEGSYFYRLRG